MQRFVRNVFVCVGVAFILASGVYGQKPALAATTKPKPIVLKAVTFLPKTSITLVNWNQLIEKVKKQSDGQLVIDYLGGPEVIPPGGLGKAVQSRVVDMGVIAGSMYEPMGPMVGLLALSRLTVEQEHEPGGVYDLLQKQHQKVGFFYLGRQTTEPDRFFRLWTKRRVEKPQDLAGKKIAGMGMIHHAFAQALEAAPVTVKTPELYTALESGVADAVQLPAVGIFFDEGFYQVVKFGIEHTYFNDNTTVVLNLDSWSQIPKHLQDLLRKAHMETLSAKRNFLREIEVKQKKIMMEAGLEFIKFLPPDASWFVETAYEAEWAKQLKKYPQDAPKFKELMSKK